MSEPETIYVIPTNCPYEEQIYASSPGVWRSIRFIDFLNFVVPGGWIIEWTCAGCTKGIGRDEIACDHRKCGLGG